MIRVRLLVLALFCGLAVGQEVDYDHSQKLSPAYTLHWAVTQGRIYIAMEVDTIGWVSFGIGEQQSGGMPGADIVVATVESDGTVTATDMYATSWATPLEDHCQQWEIVKGEQIANSKTVIHLRRDLDTKDSQDRPIVSGEMRIIWAYGEVDAFSYHQETRGMSIVTFYTLEGDKTDPDPDVFSWPVQMPGYVVPARSSTNACMAHATPSGTLHITQIDPIITNPMVQHAIVYLCKTSNPWIDSIMDRPRECLTDTNKTQIPLNICRLVYAWTLGQGSFVLPKEAGFKVVDTQIFLMQVHYDNPKRLANVNDTTGLILSVTPRLHTNDAGVIQMGDPLLSMNQPIPADLNDVQYQFSCSSACTQTWPYDINVFGDSLHMHKLGIRINSHIDSADRHETFNGADFYSFRFQQVTPLRTVIKRGDRLNLHCVYDSTSRSAPTNFGQATGEEACFEFVYYYPIIQDMDFCSFYNNNVTNRNYTICGNPFVNPSNVIMEANPTVDDGPLGTISFGTENVCDGELTEAEESREVVTVYKAPVGSIIGMSFFAFAIIVGMNFGLYYCAVKMKDTTAPLPPSSHA